MAVKNNECRKKTVRGLGLCSGGLDSMLAVRILQEQGFEVEALNIRTPFECCKTPATQAAVDLGIRMTVVSVEDDYLDLIREPVYGHGKGVNPCIDCRIFMFTRAKREMEERAADFVATGEVLGERPMSQRLPAMEIIERESGLSGRVVRPLSGRLLRQSIPEQDGLIEREQLAGIQGRSSGKSRYPGGCWSGAELHLPDRFYRREMSHCRRQHPSYCGSHRC